MKHVLRACVVLVVWLLVAGPGRVDAAEAARTHLTDKPTEADRAVLKQLQETKVSFDFNEQPLVEVFDFLMTLGNTNIVPDRTKFVDPEQKITFKMTNASLETVFDRLTEQLGLTYIIRDGAVFVSDEDGIKVAAAAAARIPLSDKATEADRKVLGQLQETIVSFTFNEQPVMEALDFLQTLGNVNIVRDRGKFARPEPKVTLKLSNVSLETALKLLTEQLGLTFIIRDGVVFISDEKGIEAAAAAAARIPLTDKPTDADRKVLKMLQETIVSFTFNEQPVMEALDFLQTLGNVNIVVDRKGFRDAKPTVTLKLTNVPLEAAIKLLTEQLGLTFVIRDGGVFISDEKGIAEGPVTVIDGESGEAIVKALGEKKVSFDLKDQTLREAVAFLSTQSGVNLAADPRAKVGDKPALDAKVRLKLKDVSVWQAVRELAAAAGLNVIASEQLVLLTDLKELKPLPDPGVPPELAKTLDETLVSLAFNDMPLADAMDFLRKLRPIGVREVIIAEDLSKRPVTLKVKDMKLRYAFNWTARFTSTTWSIRDERLFIRDENEAK